MVATIITCYIFKESANLTVAYGVAVSSVMFITTILVAIVIHVVWRFPIAVSVVFFLIFGTIDVAFLTSTLLKVHNGGWFTLLCGVLLASMMFVWRWGTTLKFQHDSNSTKFEDILIIESESHDIEPDEKAIINEQLNEQSDELIVGGVSLSEFSIRSRKSQSILRLADSGFQVSRLPGIGMFYNESGFGVPLAFKHFVQHFPAVPQILIFINIRSLTIPFVGEDDRLAVERVSDYHGCYRVTARYGYMENVSQGKEFVTKMIEAIHKIDPDNEDLSESLNNEKRVTYVLGRQSIQPKPNSFLLKRALISSYVFLDNISRQLYGNWNIPIDDVVDVGMKLAV
jgi:KUP system potassium uptake protein